MDIVVGVPRFQILPLAHGDEYVTERQPNWGSIVITDVNLTVMR